MSVPIISETIFILLYCGMLHFFECSPSVYACVYSVCVCVCVCVCVSVCVQEAYIIASVCLVLLRISL